jgi:antibiotic biosynthesis monooxygenase (ABM) superfamily enzyme
MNRRTHVKWLLAGASAVTATQAAQTKKPIQLFVEMEVVPSREKEMLDNFNNIFLPEAKKHPGYISVKLLRLRKVMQGPPQPINYRFELIYESEELRQKWISSPEHLKVWPTVERTLKSTKDYPVLLFDEV